MSTYSWSYKTPVSRTVPEKQDENEDEEEDKEKEIEIVKDEKSDAHMKESEVKILPPKRLNWRAKIYVGNLDRKTNEASLAYYFSVFGDIEDIKLIRDHNTNESRGFAFITFEKVEAAEKAKKWCSFNYPVLDDTRITVASAERKSKKINLPEKEKKLHPSLTLFWEFKWINKHDAPIFGPYETSTMRSWKNQGYFDRGCWARQVPQRVEEKKSKTNLDDVTRGSLLTGEKNIKVSETIDESPLSKKPKLVLDYSDSEDEENEGINVDNKETYGGNDDPIHNDHLEPTFDYKGIEANKGEQTSDIKGTEDDNGEQKSSDDTGVQDGNEKQKISNTKGILADTGENLRCEVDSRVRNCDVENETAIRRNDFHSSKEDREKITDEQDQNDFKECIKEGETLENKLREVIGQNGNENGVISAKDDVDLTSKHDHCSIQTQLLEDGKMANTSNGVQKGSFDLLELYERQEATGHDENETESTEIVSRDINDSSSDDDVIDDDDDVIDDDDDDITTEFVSISEIDFDFYP